MSSKPQVDEAAREALAKRFDSPAGFTTALSDEEKIAALTAKDAPQVLAGCVGFSQRLYWILRGLAELPAARMPRKQLRGVKPSAEFIADWKARNPAFDRTLNKAYLRNEVEFWIKSCRAAWHAVDLTASEIDKADAGTNRWSIRTKTAISRLSHSLGNTGNNHEHFLAELTRHLRRYPEMILPHFYRAVDELAAMVTTLLVAKSEVTGDQMPGIDGGLSFASAGFTSAQLCEKLSIADSATLNNYAKDAGVPTPKRGKRNFRYPTCDARHIAAEILENSTERHQRNKATEFLAMLGKPN